MILVGCHLFILYVLCQVFSQKPNNLRCKSLGKNIEHCHLRTVCGRRLVLASLVRRDRDEYRNVSLSQMTHFFDEEKIESEQLAKRVVTFYNNAGGHVMKQTAAHFKKEKVPERTIYNIISKYIKYNTTEFRPKSGRPRKISDQKLRSLVKSVEDRAGVSQRRLARRFNVSQSTISRNLKARTSVRVYQRRSAPSVRPPISNIEPE